MKKFFSIVANGFIVLIFPLTMTIFLLGKLHHLITPIIEFIELKLHVSRFLGIFNVLILSALIMILLGFLAGLIIRSSFVQKSLDNWERKVLMKIPVYAQIKEVLNTKQGINKYQQYHPALLLDGDKSFSLCCVTNESTEHYTVWITEGGFNGGEIRIVPKESVKILDISMIEYMRILKEYGAGSAELADKLNLP